MPRIDLSKLPDQEPVAPLAGAEPTIDLDGIPDKATKPLTSPERLPRWEDVKGKLPANLKDYEQAGKDAISVAATYDLDMNAAYNIQDKVKEELGETDLFDKAAGSFKAGIGDVYVGLGNTLKWAGMSEEFSDVYVDYGERMRVAYIPPEDTSEFTWRKTIDPEWWATSVTRAVPFTLSLIPAAVVGAYAGTAAAGAAGLGTFGTTVMGSLGGAAASRPLESAFEAAAAYEESLARGDSEEDANAAADKVFKSNMALVGMDAAQFAVAFTPLKFGKTLNPSLLRRISAGTGKLSAVALSEAGEERYQEYVQMEALGEEANFFDLDNPRLNEASTIGGIFGAGMGGTGSVWTALTRKTTEAMPEDVKQTFDVAKGNAMLDGMEEADATRVALDAVAETPEGKEHIEKVINDLKEASTKEMGAKAPEITAPTMEQLMERLQTEDLTEEELGSLLDQFAGGRDVIEEIQSEPVAAIKERLIATGMDEVEASANAALFDGFRVLAQRAGVPVEDVMARYLPEVSREGVEAPAPVVTEEDRRAITDNPFLSDQITTEEQLTDVESLRTARERINETLVEQREEQTVSDEEMKQLEEAVGFLDEKITAPAIPDTEAVADMDVLEQSAYHGTPHKFDKFTLDHIGTGEGAQAYGWGLYFAENKGVAEFYREQLSGIKFYVDGRKIDTKKLTPKVNAIIGINVDGYEAHLRSLETEYEQTQDVIDEIEEVKKLKDKNVEVKQLGNVIKVELAPKADEWLDWDKPLSEQSEKVKEALRGSDINLDAMMDKDWFKGKEIYDAIGGKGKFANASERARYQSLTLKELGIPGIRYFDATSRTEQEGTSNYVVFDDELITIEEYLQAKQEGITPEEPRGRIRISPDGINIDLLKGADQSTFVHETGHLYYKMLSDLAVLPTASEDLKADYQTVRDWLGAEEGADLTVDQQEQFARGFEAYLREGKAPSSALAEAFDNFKQWLMQIYKSLRDLNVQLTDEVRGVMDRMLADEGVEVAEVPEGVLPEAVAEETLEQSPREVKPRVRKITGQVKDKELLALREDFIRAARTAREAFKAGKISEAQKWQEKAQAIALEARSRNERKKILKSLKNIQKKNAKRGIAVEYKKKIDELLKGIDFQNMTKKKRQKLEAFAAYLEKEGTPLGIQPKYIKELRRLSQKQAKDLTTEDLKNLLDTIKHLRALGRLKSKLAKFADKRELKIKKEKLIASTINLDRKPPQTRFKSKSVRKRQDVFLDGIQNIYINTLHTIRVADMMDGFKNSNGENAKIIKNMNKAERTYNTKNVDRINDFLEKREELIGDAEITEREYAAMMIHGRFQEGSFDAVKILAETYNFDIPEDAKIVTTEDLRQHVPISDTLLKYVDLVRATITSRTDDIAALHEETTNEIFDRVDNYFAPLFYEREAAVEPGAVVRETFKDTDASGNFVMRTRKPAQGFVKSRVRGVKKVPRIDIESIVTEAISAQEWFLNMQPVLLDASSLVYSKEYQEAAGTVASNWWKNQIDIVARKGWQAGYRPNAFSNALKTMRGNLNRGVLLFKVSTVMMQPFAVFDAMAYAQAKYGPLATAEIMKEFAKVWVTPKYAEKIIDASETLTQRKGGEVALEEVLQEASKSDKIFNRLEKLGADFIVGADMRTAAAIRQGFLNVFQKMEIDNPAEQADLMVHLTQGSSDITLRPHVLASGEGARTFFTFGTFFLNRWGLIAHDLATGVIKSDTYKAKTVHLIALGILMLAGYAEDEARDILNTLLGRDVKGRETDIIADAILFIPEQAPYIGSIIKGKRRGFGGTEFPLESVVAKGVTGLVRDLPAGEIGKGLTNIAEAGLIAYYGLPGTVQLFDLLEVANKPKKKEKL